MDLQDKVKKIKIIRNKDKGTSLVRYKKSFFHAIDGFLYSLKYEHNMIIILLSAILTIIFGFIFKITLGEWFFCIMIIGMISAAELINSSIEALVDLVSPEKHPLAKIAKDTASSAVLILCITALIGALLIFIPKIIRMF